MEEKIDKGTGCDICTKAGKNRSAETHATAKHDSAYFNKKWGEKKQRTEPKNQ